MFIYESIYGIYVYIQNKNYISNQTKMQIVLPEGTHFFLLAFELNNLKKNMVSYLHARLLHAQIGA